MNRKRQIAARRCSIEDLEPKRLLADGGVVINEIMYHQAGDDTGLEFIELANPSDEVHNLRDWSFSAGVQFSFPDVSIQPGGYLVVAADQAKFQAQYPSVQNVVGGWTGRLANRGEGITLVDEADNQVDRVRYADEGDWATRILGPVDNGHRGWRWLATHDGDGKSLELKNNQLSNDFGHNWASSVPDGGTPGAANSVREDNVAPLVVDLSHSPAIPMSSDSVDISFEVADEDVATTSSVLRYRAATETEYQVIAMTRDGSRFFATIPSMPDGTVVEYSVTVTDVDGNSRTTPHFESEDPTRSANRLYQVLDDAASVEGWDPASQSVTYLVMTPAEELFLRDIGDGPLAEASSNAQMNGTYIRVDGNSVDVQYNVGVRNRGGSSRVGPPNNYRINFPHDNTLDGASSLNVNAQFTHVETIGNAVYRLAGLPAPEAIPVQLRVNGLDLADPGGSMFGSYIETETITGRFPDRYFPDDNRGNLYRVIAEGRESGDLAFRGDDPAAYQNHYLKRTNEEENDWSDLIDLVDVLNNTPEEQFAAEVNRVIDVEQWMRFIALDSLLGNRETGLNAASGDNYWLYRGMEDTRFHLIPHDLDTILDVGRTGEPNRGLFSDYVETTGLRRFLTHPEFVPQYYQAFMDLMDEVYNPETLFPLMDRLVGYIPDSELDSMKRFVVDRIAGVRAQLPRDFVVSSTLPIVDGYHRTTLPSADVVGIASPIDTRSVFVNGQPADWSSATGEWSLVSEGTGTSESLLDFGSTWSYDDTGDNLGDVWRSPQFNDGSWSTGQGPLGYGKGDEATELSFGSSPFNKNITSYFRKSFDVADASQILDLSMRLIRDDGAIVYLNGQEVARSNMPTSDVGHLTVASSWIGGGAEGQQLSFAIDPTLLVDGENVLAVEVHQVNSVDSDLRFDMSLEATVGTLSGGVPLHPGINRLQVVAYAGEDGTGEELQRDFVDVWYDGSQPIDDSLCELTGELGTPAPSIIAAGALTADTVFSPCGPAYRVTGEVTIPAGVTMTVLPGTTIFFEENAGLVFSGGQLVAEGAEFSPVRFTRAPDVATSWDGIQFTNSTADNRISHAILEYATTEDGMVGLLSSRLEVSDTTFDHADLFRIITVDSSLVVRDSTFADIFAPGEAPASDNRSEHIKGSGILAGGQLLLEGNYFGRTTGHNDSVDFDGAILPGPIPRIIDNYFAGSGDDALDLEADALILGNTFVDVVKDQFNIATGDANALSAGGGRTYYVYGNKFHNVDHAVQVKDDAFLFFDHNTVNQANISPIYFDRDDVSPGKGASVVSSIFSNSDVTFGAADQAQILEVDQSIVAADALELGDGNMLGDPRLVSPESDDFSLRLGSLAIGKAFGGRDLGGSVADGVWLSGGPNQTTGRTSARFRVGGLGVVEYQYRIDGGPWSELTAIDQSVELLDLSDGQHELEVRGVDVGGHLVEPLATHTWVVDSTAFHVRINEVLASNDSFRRGGRTPDLIELWNDSDATVDLSGGSLSDQFNHPRQYVFPEGTTIGPGEYLILEASDDAPGDLGFRLDSDGDGVFLFDSISNGGSLLDSVEFGIQVTDLSIGRVGYDQGWDLTTPTFGTSNESIAVADASRVRLNEWLASSDQRFDGDYLELHNADEMPARLSGLFLTDDPIAHPTRHEIAPLSFIGGHGFVVFDPNGNLENGANELPFGLSEDGELLALLDADQNPIDQVLLFDQTIDVSQGRAPDGDLTVLNQVLGTPGAANPVFVTTTTQLMSFNETWRYDQSGDDLGTAWRSETFDDSQWSSGPGPLGFVNGETSVPIQTPLEIPRDRGVTTHYFRSEFELSDDLFAAANANFEISTLIDDGAIIYVIGQEFMRLGMRDGEVTSTTTASRGIPLASVEGPFTVPRELLRSGTNAISVEVHQVSRSNSDVAFGLEMKAEQTGTDAFYERAIALQDGLRVSEIMYHPSGDAEAEFVELLNLTDTRLSLRGVSIVGDIDLDFTGAILDPGEHAVIVRDVTAFQAEYGTEVRILGAYDGNLPNSFGQFSLRLPSPLDEQFSGDIVHVAYDDSWHPTTDGDGFSLQIVEPTGALSNWNQSSGWRASLEVNGSPGRDEDRIVGDTNFDGQVDFGDFLALSANFGNTDAVWADGDFDDDGLVGFSDFLLLAANFGFERD